MSAISSMPSALALFPPIIILNIIFDGKNISEENTPACLKWVNKVGLIRWGFTGLALNEFEGLGFTSTGPFRGPGKTFSPLLYGTRHCCSFTHLLMIWINQTYTSGQDWRRSTGTIWSRWGLPGKCDCCTDKDHCWLLAFELRWVVAHSPKV